MDPELFTNSQLTVVWVSGWLLVQPLAAPLIKTLNPEMLLMHSSECECVNEWLGEWLNEACSKKAQRQSREVPIHLSVKNRKNCFF